MLEDGNTLTYLLVVAENIIPVVASIIAVSKNNIKSRRWKLTQKIANEAMTTVETYAKTHQMTSDQKLMMGVDTTEIGVKAAGLSWDEPLKEKVTEYINEMCVWSKTVNSSSTESTKSKKILL